MKSFKYLLALMALSFLAVGCADKKEAALAEKNSEPLQFIWFSDGNEGDVMQGILDDFEAESGIKVELITVPYGDHETKITTMIQGGKAPALARVTNPQYFQDFALDLSEVTSADDFIPARVVTMKGSNGKLIAVPVDVTANGIIMNKTLAEKHGVNYPKEGDKVWTWDEFIAEMKKFNGGDIAYPGVFDYSPP